MNNLKDQIQQKIRNERQLGYKQTKPKDAAEVQGRLAEIRPRLDELSHTTDEYSLKIEYAKGPYATDIAVLELYDANAIWVAGWQVATMSGGSGEYWEVTYNPHGVETQHKWFRKADDLFTYLTTSIAERVIEMGSGQ